MKQSRATSLIKSLVSTAVGFAVAFFANMLILPFFGLDISHGANFILTCIYTVISIARGYALERIFEAMGWRTRMSAFALAVLAERQRQIAAEGYDAAHDNQHSVREIAQAGAAYLIGEKAVTVFDPDIPTGRRVRGFNLWPWSDGYKPALDDTRRDLARGCALGLAAGELHDANRKRKPVVTERPVTANAEVA